MGKSFSLIKDGTRPVSLSCCHTGRELDMQFFYGVSQGPADGRVRAFLRERAGTDAVEDVCHVHGVNAVDFGL